ncbi:MAG: hypothetical protein GY884_32380 [Proteobacteria bacterium]|nr:hypothetical protein [Pseudomonadota bacterium]
MLLLLLACKPTKDAGDDPVGDSGLDSAPCVLTTLWADADGDGYGDPTSSSEECEGVTGWAAARGDCDDTNALVNPGVDETCNGADDDCDGLIDGADDSLTDGSTLHEDRDGDGYGDADSTLIGCEGDGVTDDSDCDDDDPNAHPGATWYVDRDEDGYGDPTSAVVRCTAPPQHVADGTDCDDDSAEAHPGGIEVCDGVDNDCEESTSEAGAARFVSDDGVAVTMTSALSGSSSNTKLAELTTDGTLSICEGTWYVELDVDADLAIQGHGAVTLDGADDNALVSISEGHTVSLSDLTLTHGSSAQGGAISCTDTALSLDRVDVIDNDATYGGAIWASECLVELSDVSVSENTATYAGALYLNASDLAATDTAITDNDASIYTVYVSGSSGGGGRSTVDLDEVELSDNVLTNYVHGYFKYADVTWTGSATSDSGMLRNTASSPNYGSLYLSQSTLDATSVDFEDNEEVDLYHSTGLRYTPGEDATFTCDADSCGRSSTYDLGGTDSGGAYSKYVLGALVEADTTATIDRLQFYGSSSSCDLDAYVYSSTTGSGTWTLEWSDTSIPLSSSDSWHTTDDVGVPVEDGVYYIVAFGWTCSVDTHLSTSGLSTDAGFGQVVGYAYKTSASATLTGDTTFSTSTSYEMPWRIRIEATEL